jgi:hypothetical protein
MAVKIDQMAVKICRQNGSKNTYQHLPLQDHPKFTQIGILGFKIYHLATLIDRKSFSVTKSRILGQALPFPVQNVFFIYRYLGTCVYLSSSLVIGAR